VSVRAVVFAYHDVGVRCLKTLLAKGIDVPLVITHADDPRENTWFASVADVASDHGLRCITPADANGPQMEDTLSELQPEFIFSFYYRQLLASCLLRHARLGAFNMHGSLLPRYRGRAPVNWAILRGETETGVTLHEMVERADAGPIVDQMSVPILIEDTALEVFTKITVAAEIVLARSLPALMAGNAPRRAQDLTQGCYVGRRRPEDGRIDWRRSALEIHNLVRAVAPPFPGAFTELVGRRLWIHRTRLIDSGEDRASAPQIFCVEGRCLIRCGDGRLLQLLAAATDEGPVRLDELSARLARRPISLI